MSDPRCWTVIATLGTFPEHRIEGIDRDVQVIMDRWFRGGPPRV